jgi:hypothetical protein
MKKQIKIPELIEMISSVVEKSRDTLSENEVKTLEETIEVLRGLELEAEKNETRKKVELIALNMLKFFTKPEIMEQLIEWFNS